MKEITNCRLCSACCPVEVDVINGQLQSAERITPFEKTITCPKLINAKNIVYSKDRILTPLLRKNLKEDFREVSWEEALNFIGRKIEKTKNRYSSQSIALLRGMAADWGTSWDYTVRFMSALGSPNAIGNGSVCFVAREMAHTYTYGTITIPQLKDSKCIIIWGKNDRNTAPIMAEAIIYAKEKGAKLIVIDPVKTFFADMADIWLRVKPAHDGALAMAIMKVIVDEGLYDKDFVETYCLGFDALRESLSMMKLKDLAQMCWIPVEQIQKTARIYAKSKPACIIDGNGLDMQTQVFQTTRAVCLIRAITGNIDIEGGDFIPHPIPLANIQLRDKISAVPSVMLHYKHFEKFHPTWGLHAQSCLIDAIIEEKPYPVKFLFIQSGNPAVTMMDSTRVRKALEKLDCLVMIDIFKNKTSQYAHVILPACSCFEKTQINRAYIRNSFIMLQKKVIKPLGESKSDIEIIFELAKATGLSDYFPWKNDEEALDFQLKPTGLSLDILKKNPTGIWYEKPKFRKYENEGFKTPSKKVEIFSKRLSDNDFDPIPFFKGFPNKVTSFSEENDYKFIGISGERVSCYTHTQFRKISQLRNMEKEPYVDINPSDGKNLKLKNGDLVRISTPRGKIEMKVRVNSLVSEGVVRIAWGWGEESDCWNLNFLTDDFERDPLTGTPSGRSFYCKIEKLGE
jgi:anaerobic selenocysteine-containing dehydrogenase